jgi:hypothetical protein
MLTTPIIKQTSHKKNIICMIHILHILTHNVIQLYYLKHYINTKSKDINFEDVKN